jgi:hypothetical protein
VGYDLIADVQKHTARNIVYGAVHIAFEPVRCGADGGVNCGKNRCPPSFGWRSYGLLKLHSREPAACQQCGTAAPTSLLNETKFCVDA